MKEATHKHAFLKERISPLLNLWPPKVDLGISNPGLPLWGLAVAMEETAPTRVQVQKQQRKSREGFWTKLLRRPKMEVGDSSATGDLKFTERPLTGEVKFT
jgi:hypothetical protein